jgi:hypothetical protein
MGRLPAQACNRAVVPSHQHRRFEPAPIAEAIDRLAVTNPVSHCLSGAAWLLVGPDDREAAWQAAMWSSTAGGCGTSRPANVKRHVLTHRHTDLKDEFYARVRARGHVPASEQELRDQLKATQEKLAEAHEENRQLKESVETFARIVNVLTLENDRLIQQSEQGSKTLIPLRPSTN